MAKSTTKQLSKDASEKILITLKKRFDANMQRHPDADWTEIESRLQNNKKYLSALNAMESTGGEPDLIEQPGNPGEYMFCDCSPESPSGRRSLCYDRQALQSRKENKPSGSALELATEMGIELLDEETYRHLQKFGRFDSKTSSWLKTPSQIRSLGGAIFGDFRYATVFIYHNGAESYYAARGFRGALYLV